MEYQVEDLILINDELFKICHIDDDAYLLQSNNDKDLYIRTEKWATKNTFKKMSILEAATKLNGISILVNNKEQYDTLMRYFDENKICWESWNIASEKDYWRSTLGDFYIVLKPDDLRRYVIAYQITKPQEKLNNSFRYSYFDELKQYELVENPSILKSGADFADAMSYATSYLNSNKISICPDKITVCADRFNISDGYKLDGRYLDEEFIKQPYFKEENIMKILDIYEEKQTKLIEKKYDKQIEELEENDRLRVYFKQVEETVREMLELTEDEICTVSLNTPVISLTKETIAKKEEIVKLIREEKAELKNKIKEIQALLEFAPDYEETMQILRDYGIIDKKKNIIL